MFLLSQCPLLQSKIPRTKRNIPPTSISPARRFPSRFLIETHATNHRRRTLRIIFYFALIKICPAEKLTSSSASSFGVGAGGSIIPHSWNPFIDKVDASPWGEWVLATRFEQQPFCLAAENTDIRRRLCPVRVKLKRTCATCGHRIGRARGIDTTWTTEEGRGFLA